MNRIRVQHPKDKEWYTVVYSDKVYNSEHLAILAEFVKDVASMSYDYDICYVCKKVPNGAVMVTDDAVYFGTDIHGFVHIRIIENMRWKNTETKQAKE